MDEKQHPPAPNIGIFERAVPCFICGKAIEVRPAAIAVTDNYRDAEDNRFSIFFTHRECIEPHVHASARQDFDAAG